MTVAVPHAEHSRKAWGHVAMVFAFMVVNYADKAVIGLASVPIMRDLGLSNTQFGKLGSAFFLLFSITGVAGGFLANRFSTKRIMLGMALIWGLTLAPISLASSFGALLASRIVLGAAEGPSFPVAVHAVYRWFADRDRALPTSVVACGAAFGTGVVAPFISALIVALGWRAAFAVLGAVGLGWACLWHIAAADGPIDGQTRSTVASLHRVAYRTLLSSRTAAGVLLAGFGAYWIVALNLSWLGNYLVRALHLGQAHAAWIIVLPSVTQMVLAPAVAWVSQLLLRQGRSSRLARGIPGASCVIAAGVFMMCMTLVDAGPLQIALIALSFSIGSVIFTLGSALIGEITPPAQRGAMLGMTNSFHTLAGLCAPWVMGRVLDAAPGPAAGFRTGYLCAGGGVAVLGCLAAALIDPAADLRRFRRVSSHR